MEAAGHKMVNRSATPRQAPAAVPLRSMSTGTAQLRSALPVSSPRALAEKEEKITGRKITRTPVPQVLGATGAGNAPHRAPPSPYIARFADSILLMRRHTGQREAGAPVAAEVSRSQGSGAPLPTGVRNLMDRRIGADFGQVRIHTRDGSARLHRKVSARASTAGQKRDLGRSQHPPETSEGRKRIAHGPTHTVQQGAAKQRGAAKPRGEAQPRDEAKKRGAAKHESSPHPGGRRSPPS